MLMVMITTNKAGKDLLLLTENEKTVIDLFKDELPETPVTLSKRCSIPRPTIYLILENLKKRGLVYSFRKEGRKGWQRSDEEAINQHLSKARAGFRSKNSEYQKLNLNMDTDLTIYRGEKTISSLFLKLIEKHGGSRLMGIQGDHVGEAWKKTFSLKKINEVNRMIKEKGMLTEIITSKDWFKKQVTLFGRSWGENFIGRAAQVHFIESKYLDYESQIFIFENQLYLVSMSEELFIEVKNEQVSKLIISLLKFVEDHSSSVDVNKILGEMLDKN